jgi:hypothetical protein
VTPDFDVQPIVEANRKDHPASIENCSWLMEQMRPIEFKKDAGKDNHPTQDDLYDFYDGEMDARPGKLTGRYTKAR